MPGRDRFGRGNAPSETCVQSLPREGKLMFPSTQEINMSDDIFSPVGGGCPQYPQYPQHPELPQHPQHPESEQHIDFSLPGLDVGDDEEEEEEE